MHAVIRTGGKQYYVAAGDILEVEKLEGKVGDTIELADVLLLAGDGEFTVGQPVVDGAGVIAKITGQHRGEKIRVFRYRPKKRIRVRKGHRQYLTRLQIQSIRLADGTEFQGAAPAATPIEEPVAEEPMAAGIVTEAPVMEAPVVEEIVAEAPATGESMVEETVAEPIEETEASAAVEQADNDDAASAPATTTAATTAEAENKE